MKPAVSPLEKLQRVMEVEESLTETLEKAELWVPTKNTSERKENDRRPRVRPLPTTLDQATQILQLARTWSSRTSAPAGWHQNSTVSGFCAPCPFPHQLRAGGLAALQLERARLQQQKVEQVIKEDRKETKRVKTEEKVKRDAAPARRPVAAQAPSQVVVSMNLSDSSSDDEDD